MADRVFVGFGFGAIQAGLFVLEAFESRSFDRLVVAEVNPAVVNAVRENDGCYRVNVANPTGIHVREIENIEIYNPLDREDEDRLVDAVAAASELSTALPSVNFYDSGVAPVGEILARGISKKLEDARFPAAVVYTAENHNHAAEHLEATVLRCLCQETDPILRRVQFLNTVIGKMSGVVQDAERIRSENLRTIAEGLESAFLVESFNRILISQIRLENFHRGIAVFHEKQDLLPFEEAKLFGHNAVHALIGFLSAKRGYQFIYEASSDAILMKMARDAFLLESGEALIHRRHGIDPLFTPEGYQAYADDLLDRMLNPYLRDTVERVIRDPQRKLGWDDRLVGTMRLALEAGIKPERFAYGVATALVFLGQEIGGGNLIESMIPLWKNRGADDAELGQIIKLIEQARGKVTQTLGR